MFTATQYRAKAAEYTELLKAASLPAETREFRKLEQSYLTLAENEEWMADNLEKINSPGADENWYGDAILAHQGQQGKHTLGCLGADVATQSTAIPTQIQQLFDDAGSMGGRLQTATLRGQIARFLHKHKVDDFR
jgi:LPS sulfotransferase NodH